MFILDSTSKKITAVLSGAAATTNPDFTSCYLDVTTSGTTPGGNDGALNGTTAVDVVASPAASTQRLVRAITIQNRDTASVTLTLRLVNGVNTRQIWAGTLDVGSTLQLDEDGLKVLDSTGGLKYSTTVATGSLALSALADIAANTILGNDTGSAGPVTTISCTSAGRDLLDDANASAQRTTLGLAIGTDVQAYDADLAAIAALSSTGIAVRTASNTWAQRTITGTADKITVTDGDGVAGNPTLTISATYAGQNTIVTLGTITSGTWNGSTIGVGYGGTGQTSYTDGQLLIGNTTGNTLTKATLTAPAAGITITGGSGSITFALANDLSALEGLASTGMAARTASDTWTVRTITAGSSKVSISNGDGVSGNPTVDVTEANLTLGNIGGTLGETKGGTNQTTYTTGDLLYASASNTLSKRGIGSTGDVLTVSGGVPTWAAPTSGSASKALLRVFY